jgi:hypothetical protein
MLAHRLGKKARHAAGQTQGRGPAHVLIKLDFNQLLPEIDLVGSYGRNASELTSMKQLDTIRQGNYPFYSYGVMMTDSTGQQRRSLQVQVRQGHPESAFFANQAG